jgi:hypothetical protein
MSPPLSLLKRYKNILVEYDIDHPKVGPSRKASATVALNGYFMNVGRTAAEHRAAVTHGLGNDTWFKQYKARIETAAMGKGSPQDYALALQWAVYSGKITNPSQATLQHYLDTYMGIDCSGFVTNYLIASRRVSYSPLQADAASYYHRGMAVSHQHQIRCGDLLVMMEGHHPKRHPAGHIVVVNDYLPIYTGECSVGIVESRGHHGLTYSRYIIQKIEPQRGTNPMILVMKRFGHSHCRFAVRRC